MLKKYYYLTKPGIIYGNAMTAAAGFLLAARWHIHYILFLAMLAGTSLVIASACVFNNYLDRGIDAKMARTKRRALVKGTIPARQALLYGTILGLVGCLLLISFTNYLTIGVGIVAFLDYVVFYGIAKRRSRYGTLVGSIAGAAPVVAGYTAVTGRLDGAALSLFLLLTFWQMPHFYAIAMYRFDDYKAAGLPVLPVAKSVAVTKRHILAYIVAFNLAVLLPTILGYTGYVYLVVMGLVSLYWLWLGVQGFRSADDKRWGRRMFLFSLVVILSLSVMLAVGPILP